jgi:hypothetical protein
MRIILPHNERIPKMQQNAIPSDRKTERKIISVSAKRQLTIPQKYFDALGFNNEAECILQYGGILIRPLRNAGNGEFAEYILSDLIAQGYEGSALLEKFREQNSNVRPAVQSMLLEAEAYVKSGKGEIARDALFGTAE